MTAPVVSGDRQHRKERDMKILAVDDDPIILELLEQFMLSVGQHDLTTAQSGAEALDIIDAEAGETYDCFLFDIQMPSMDGTELTKAVRATPEHVDTPILMLTAMSDKGYIDEAFAAGATDYVTKPFEVFELKARIGLVEGLAIARRKDAKKIFDTFESKFAPLNGDPINTLDLHQPISIYDVENVIDHMAMENYVAQLSRGALFGSSTFAFNIRNVVTLHGKLTPFEFYSLISDVSEVVSDELKGRQFLMSYAAGGTFVCVSENGWKPDAHQLMDSVNLRLAHTELFNNAGQRLDIRVSVGDVIRLIWKSGASAVNAVAHAHSSAESASDAHEKSMYDFWLQEKYA
jgi:CheY-like chemotaxis protein